MLRKSTLNFLLFFVVIDLCCSICLLAAEDTFNFNEDVSIVNVTSSGSNRSKEDSFAGMLDRALEKEFPENDDQSDGYLLTYLLTLISIYTFIHIYY